MKKTNVNGAKPTHAHSIAWHSLRWAAACIVVYLVMSPIPGKAQERWERCGNKLKEGVKVDARWIAPGPDGTVQVLTTNDGRYESWDFGRHWKRMDRKVCDGCVILCTTVHGGFDFAGTESGMYRSSDKGNSWMAVGAEFATDVVWCVVHTDTNLFVGTDQGVFRSSDNGDTWTLLDGKMDVRPVQSMKQKNGVVYAGTDHGLYVSTDEGSTWARCEGPVGQASLIGIGTSDKAVFVLLGSGLYRSTDKGSSWSEDKLPNVPLIFNRMTVHDSSVFVIGTVFSRAGIISGVLRSTDDGETWSDMTTGIRQTYFNDIESIGTVLFLGTYWGIYRSTDNGESWNEANTGIGRVFIDALTGSAGALIAGTVGEGILRSTNRADTWSESAMLYRDDTITSFATSGDTIFAASRYLGVQRSTNDGLSWTGCGLDSGVSGVMVSGGDVFATTVKSGILYRSHDHGESWQPLRLVVWPNTFVETVATIDGVLVAGTTANGVYRSTDNGARWVRASAGIDKTSRVEKIMATGHIVFARVTGKGLYRSKDQGDYWSFAGTGLENQTVMSIVAYGNSIFAGTTSGAYRSQDEGRTWTSVPAGLGGAGVRSLAVVSSTLYAGTDSSYIYKWLENATDVGDRADVTQTTTTISIRPEPASDELTLRCTTAGSRYARVYALRSSGEIQTQIADGMHDAGEHTVNVDTRSWPSGVYCIVVQTETDVARKMVVVVR